MTVEFLDHTADVALRATGRTVEEAFEEAARGMFAVMVDTDRVRQRESLSVRVAGADRADLLIAWLGALLAEKDLSGWVFSGFSVSIGTAGDELVLDGEARGEPFDATRHRPGNEVKGISLLGLEVREEATGWIAQCVLDV
jgi:SHS2 domain-containing protein